MRQIVRVDFNRIASSIPKIIKDREKVAERSRRDNEAIRRHAGIASPTRKEKPKIDFARLARGELSEDQQRALDRIKRAKGIVENEGDRMLNDAAVSNVRHAALRGRKAMESQKEDERLRAEAQRILRDGSAPTAAEAFRSALGRGDE